MFKSIKSTLVIGLLLGAMTQLWGASCPTSTCGTTASTCGTSTCGTTASTCGTSTCGTTASTCPTSTCGTTTSTCPTSTCGTTASTCPTSTCGTTASTCPTSTCGTTASTCPTSTCGTTASTCGTSTCGTSTCGTSTCGTSTCGTSTCGTSTCGTSTCGTTASTCGTTASTCGTSTCGTSTKSATAPTATTKAAATNCTLAANNDLDIAITDNKGTILAVLKNDSCVKTCGTVSYTQALHGTVSIDDAGTTKDPSDDVLIYTAQEGYTGTDSFEYTLTNCEGASDTASVTLNINPSSGKISSENISSNSAGLSTITTVMMLIFSGILGLFFIRKEELETK